MDNFTRSFRIDKGKNAISAYIAESMLGYKKMISWTEYYEPIKDENIQLEPIQLKNTLSRIIQEIREKGNVTDKMEFILFLEEASNKYDVTFDEPLKTVVNKFVLEGCIAHFALNNGVANRIIQRSIEHYTTTEPNLYKVNIFKKEAEEIQKDTVRELQEQGVADTKQMEVLQYLINETITVKDMENYLMMTVDNNFDYNLSAQASEVINLYWQG